MEECPAGTWIEQYGTEAWCALAVGHDGKHDDGEGWEW